MVRRRTPSPPQSANLNVEQMRAALPRLERRIVELSDFDPTKVTKRGDPSVVVMENAIDDFLTRTFGEGSVEYRRYSTAGHLDTAPIYVGHVAPLHEVIQGLQSGRNRAIEILGGIRNTFLEEISLATPVSIDQSTQSLQPVTASRNVFVVHGSNHGARDTVARFLEGLDLSPIILEEKPNEGRTIHQKFRDHSTVDYAIVLFTPDDVGAPASSPGNLKARARQNVIYELGFFAAKLGDRNVCVLHSEEVEIPSDMSGVIYVPFDPRGAWRLQVAKEMKAAGMEIDLEKV